MLGGYFIVRFKEIGTQILSVKIDNLFERIIFMNKDNADKFIKKIHNNDLHIYHTIAYAGNKVVYEKNMNMLNDINMEDLQVI